MFFIPATTANDLRVRRISIPDLIHCIIFLSLFLRKSQYFPFLVLSAKQGNCWKHFYNVFGMTRSLTGHWTRNLTHSKPISCFSSFWEKTTEVLPPCDFETTQCSGTAFYMSYIHPRTMYVVPMEKAWKDDSNHKYSQVDSKGFINKAACCNKCLLWILFFVYCFDNFDSIF